MHLVDTTMFYSARSGGVKRYLNAKHDWLIKHAPQIRHTLLVPQCRTPTSYVVSCSSRSLHLPDGYRLPVDLLAWRKALLSLQPDLIEAADPYIPAWAARLVAHRLQVPAVAFFHSDMPRMIGERVGHWSAAIARPYLRQLYRGFDLVLAPSALMHERLLDAGIDHSAIQPLGVDVDVFHPARRNLLLRRQLGLNADTRLLVYAGRFAIEKNIPALLRTVERLGRPYHLLLIGGRRRERVSSQATVLPYQRNSERLAALLASCDALVHAGDQETFGLVAAEAMGCGLPVVAVAGGALSEIVDDSVGRLAPSNRVLDEAVAAVFAGDVAALGAAARRRAVMSHSWENVFRQLLGRYASLTAPALARSLSTALVRVRS